METPGPIALKRPVSCPKAFLCLLIFAGGALFGAVVSSNLVENMAAGSFALELSFPAVFLLAAGSTSATASATSSATATRRAKPTASASVTASTSTSTSRTASGTRTSRPSPSVPQSPSLTPSATSSASITPDPNVDITYEWADVLGSEWKAQDDGMHTDEWTRRRKVAQPADVGFPADDPVPRGYILTGNLTGDRYRYTAVRAAAIGTQPVPHVGRWPHDSMRSAFVMKSCAVKFAHVNAWARFASDASLPEEAWAFFYEDDIGFTPPVTPHQVHKGWRLALQHPSVSRRGVLFLGLCGAQFQEEPDLLTSPIPPVPDGDGIQDGRWQLTSEELRTFARQWWRTAGSSVSASPLPSPVEGGQNAAQPDNAARPAGERRQLRRRRRLFRGARGSESTSFSHHKRNNNELIGSANSENDTSSPHGLLEVFGMQHQEGASGCSRHLQEGVSGDSPGTVVDQPVVVSEEQGRPPSEEPAQQRNEPGLEPSPPPPFPDAILRGPFQFDIERGPFGPPSTASVVEPLWLQTSNCGACMHAYALRKNVARHLARRMQQLTPEEDDACDLYRAIRRGLDPRSSIPLIYQDTALLEVCKRDWRGLPLLGRNLVSPEARDHNGVFFQDRGSFSSTLADGNYGTKSRGYVRREEWETDDMFA